ncbi:MAG: hypothetical protein IH621_09280 [Krumholzibacteria bacterium]|nr:hypothetical protein [Candidatus Krumholzibacteria bacterium]
MDVEKLFDRMDAWRHFPNYQLERRADLLFSLYLPQVLSQEARETVCEEIAPEFPIRIGTIYSDKPTERSYKIDYLAVSESGKRAFLVELKTDGASRRESQDSYLLASAAAGMTPLLEGLLEIFRVTQAKRKYYCLLEQLAAMGLLSLPDELRTIVHTPTLLGVNEASRRVKITSAVENCEVLYIQPKGSGVGVISFEDFAARIEGNQDRVASRFARSLREWSSVEAGRREFI